MRKCDYVENPGLDCKHHGRKMSYSQKRRGCSTSGDKSIKKFQEFGL